MKRGRNLLTVQRKALPPSSLLGLLILWVRNACSFSSVNIQQKALHCKLFVLKWWTAVLLDIDQIFVITAVGMAQSV
jgi:hypothetical protein